MLMVEMEAPRSCARSQLAAASADPFAMQQRSDRDEMRLVHLTKVENLWNSAIREHRTEEYASHCPEPDLKMCDEEQRGLCWKMRLRCRNCDYASTKCKLYDDIPSSGRGAKAAAPNRGVHLGLQDTTIGPTKLRLLVASTNMPPPSRSGLQKNAATVSAETVQLTETDMSDLRKALKTINDLRGLDKESPINIQMDVRYNAISIASRHKMGQSALQAIGLAIEDHTDDHKIIGMYICKISSAP
ncbi:PREDICTED: uncharacterized protein LOC106805096 [Priapulus caudatus]|uniref:Uncharacterized protein LOC106805096 n=1 Tax=Priapulus caudatus TaxID=37621 RepID=A0ABM1DQ39_PRICU|nr:PREDICTED: uncharacterized protein LOC106805096 [Priapulus caudatus]